MFPDTFKLEVYCQNVEWDVCSECDMVGKDKFGDKKGRKRFIFAMKTLRLQQVWSPLKIVLLNLLPYISNTE